MLTLADRLLLLAFELRLAGWPADRVTMLYDAADLLSRCQRNARLEIGQTDST